MSQSQHSFIARLALNRSSHRCRPHLESTEGYGAPQSCQSGKVMVECRRTDSQVSGEGCHAESLETALVRQLRGLLHNHLICQTRSCRHHCPPLRETIWCSIVARKTNMRGPTTPGISAARWC